MESSPDTVAHKIPNDPVPLGDGPLLDLPADFVKPHTRPAGGNRALQARAGHIDELARSSVDIPHRHCPRVVSIPPLVDHPEVESDDVTITQHPLLRGDPMDDFFVHRNTEASRESVQSLESWGHAPLSALRLGCRVQIERRHSGDNHQLEFVKDLADRRSRDAHQVDFAFRFQDQFTAPGFQLPNAESTAWYTDSVLPSPFTSRRMPRFL